MTQEKKWYAVYVQARHEKKIAQRLEEKGIEHFLPIQRTLKQWSDRKKWVEETLIKSYLFVNIATDTEYLEVLKTTGTVCFITFGGKAAAIPEYQINNLRLITESDAEFESCDELKEGQQVRIQGGSMNGLTGILTEIKGKHKVLIHIDHLDYNFSVTLGKNKVEPI